jgi:hypothetical protein
MVFGKNSCYFSTLHELTDFYNLDGVCSLFGTVGIYNYNSGYY